MARIRIQHISVADHYVSGCWCSAGQHPEPTPAARRFAETVERTDPEPVNADEFMPSVDADWGAPLAAVGPAYRTPQVAGTLDPSLLIERRKANNVNQAIEFLNAAGRRAGDR